MKKMLLSLALLASTVAGAKTLDVTIKLDEQEFVSECVQVDEATNSCVLDQDGIRMVAQLVPHDEQVTISFELSEKTRSGEEKVLCNPRIEAKWDAPADIRITDEGTEVLSVSIVAKK